MNDIEIAKKVLWEENQKIVVVKEGQVLFKSIDRGIKPMYYLAQNMKEEVRGSSLADRVIGKGAAIICGYLGVKKLYAELISQNAISVLDKEGIAYEFRKKCDYIKNRDKTDYCPIEKRSLDTENPEVLLSRIEVFLKSLK